MSRTAAMIVVATLLSLSIASASHAADHRDGPIFGTLRVPAAATATVYVSMVDLHRFAMTDNRENRAQTTVVVGFEIYGTGRGPNDDGVIVHKLIDIRTSRLTMTPGETAVFSFTAPANGPAVLVRPVVNAEGSSSFAFPQLLELSEEGRIVALVPPGASHH